MPSRYSRALLALCRRHRNRHGRCSAPRPAARAASASSPVSCRWARSTPSPMCPACGWDRPPSSSATRCAPASPPSCRPRQNLFLERVPAAIYVGNGFGKLLGVTQVAELGELETPILLTCTLCVWRAADAMVTWMLEQPGMEKVRSINPVVGETNDGYVLNAIRSRLVSRGRRAPALTTATRAAPSPRGALARAPGRSRSSGRAGSARHRAS